MKINSMKVSDIAQLGYLVAESDGSFTAHSINDGLAMTGQDCCFIALNAQSLRALLDKQSGEQFMFLVQFDRKQRKG